MHTSAVRIGTPVLLVLALLVPSLVLPQGSAAAGPGAAAASVVSEKPARPRIRSLTPSSGFLEGGTRVVLRGTALGSVRTVRFGTQPARIVSTTRSSVTVITPAGPVGNAPVVAVSKGGRSKSVTFRYVARPAEQVSTITPVADTYVVAPADLQWVAGGPQDDDLVATAREPWVVSLRPSAPTPSVGQALYLAPGGSIFPSGVVGTASSLAGQEDGSVRITVTPTPLDEVLSDVSLAFSPAPSPAGRRRAEVTYEQDIASSVAFPSVSVGAFDCKGVGGEPVNVAGSVSITFPQLRPEFRFNGGLRPSFSAFVSGVAQVSGKVTASTQAATCTLKPAWANAHRKVIPLGTTGATLSFGPTASLSISAKGTFEVLHRTRFVYGLRKDSSGVDITSVAESAGSDVKLDASITVEAEAGVSVQLGFLDRIGVELAGVLALDASLSAPIVTTEANPQACVRASIGFRIDVGAFLDLFVLRWESPTKSVSLSLGAFDRCSPVPTAAGDDGRLIAPAALPDATLGRGYGTQLPLSRPLPGRWSAASALPPGLSLTPDGILQGTSTGAVTTYRFMVKFTANDGRTDTEYFQLRVVPATGIGGGDLQATLVWNSSADLDLHALEPDGNEIYYRFPGPSGGGGRLDRDSNAGCRFVDSRPSENIHWPASSASSGEYVFFVDTYDTCDQSDLSWHLIVRSQGRIVVDVTGQADSQQFMVTYDAGSGRVSVRS